MSAVDYTRDFDVVDAAERAVVDARRARRKEAPDAPRWGIALSSGGTRSAAFGLGVLQALEQGGAYRKLDYVSSASGGSYLGAALAWLTRDRGAAFPFEQGSKEARYLREHCNYLNPRAGGISFLSLIGQVATQSTISILVYGSLLVGAFFMLGIADAIFDLFKPALHTASRADWWYSAVESMNAALAVGISCIVATAALRLFARISYWLGRSLVRRRPVDVTVAYRNGLRRQRLLGRMVVVTGSALLLGSIPPVVRALAAIIANEVLRALLFSLLLGLALAFAVKSFGSKHPQHANGRPALHAYNRLKVIAAALSLYVLLLASHDIAWVITDSGVVASIGIVVALGVVAGFSLNLNALGPARIYRDRLIEAFMPDPESIASGRWQPASQAAGFALTDLLADSAAPFPLINCDLIAPRSELASLRDRGGDSFLLSPVYSGSQATGWRRTATWPQRRPITLGTAVAISSAALTPDAADVGQGVGRGRIVSVVMALFNLRLDYWIENPDPSLGRRARRFPSLLSPGLRQSVLGFGLSEREPWLQLGDGAHFDALGLYELVRRELDVIIVSDVCPGDCLQSLGSVTERVRSDFDAHLTLDAGDTLTSRGYALGSIRYRTGREATLIYLRPALTAELPIDVRSYAEDHPAFPREAASEYMSSEAEFEAYRVLGHAIAASAIAQRIELEAVNAPRESMWRALRGAPAEEQASGQ